MINDILTKLRLQYVSEKDNARREKIEQKARLLTEWSSLPKEELAVRIREYFNIQSRPATSEDVDEIFSDRDP